MCIIAQLIPMEREGVGTGASRAMALGVAKDTLIPPAVFPIVAQ
jgi:hypothetical protein